MSPDRCGCGTMIDPATAEQEYINGELAFVCVECVVDVPDRCVDCGSDGECLRGCPSRLP